MGINYSALVIETDRTCLLVGTWVSMMTWGILAMQLLTYVRTWKRDPAVLRTGILFLFCNETAITVMMCVGVHHQIIEVQPGTMEFFTIAPVYSAFAYLHTVTLGGVNWFYIWRYYRLSKNPWIAFGIFASTMATVGCQAKSATLGMTAAREAIANPANVRSILIEVATIIRVSYALEIFTLTATLTALLTELIRRAKNELLTAKQLVKRLIILNVGSGGFTLLLCIATFIYSLRNVSANVLVFISCLSRSYLMAMFFNLSIRDMFTGSKSNNPTLSHLRTAVGTVSYKVDDGPYQGSRNGRSETGHDDYEMDGGTSVFKEEKSIQPHAVSFPVAAHPEV